jgi:transcriptional regulator with XRE-family HTH domain
MRLADLVHCWRLVHGITVREGARQIGLTPPTLHRFENGRDTSGATLARVMQWALDKEEDSLESFKRWVADPDGSGDMMQIVPLLNDAECHEKC